MYSEMSDLTLVALVALRDPPREDVPASIQTIRRAGVRVFMVTGDFKLTAVAIARQVSCSLQFDLQSRIHDAPFLSRLESSHRSELTQSTTFDRLLPKKPLPSHATMSSRQRMTRSGPSF